MVIGSGLIASAFRPFSGVDDILIFASGVSNSTTAIDADYAREQQLLEDQAGTSARLVYFSTCSLYDPTLRSSPYILHKARMEKLVSSLFPDHVILRLPNIIGPGSNPHTLGNHIRDYILDGRTLVIHRNACRYLMDVDILYPACEGMIRAEAFSGKVVDVCFDQPTGLPELVKVMEEVLGKTAVVTEVERGACYEVDNAMFKAHWHSAKLGPWPEAGHWHTVIEKYYGRPAKASTGS